MYKMKWFTLITLFVMSMTAWASEENLTIIGGDEVTIREFMRVYLQDMSPPDTETIIYVGQLPEDMSVQVPTPESNVIGAVVRKGPYPTTELILTSNETVEVVDQFMDTALTEAGWERIGISYGQRGFVMQDATYGDFCNADKDKYVNVNIRQMNESTSVRINLNEEPDPYVCNQGNMEEVYNNDPYLRLPKLTTPEGVTMLINRGGGGGGGFPGTMYAASSTWLNSEVLNINDLMDVYNQQIIDNGWDMISTETGEHTSLSLWSFTDNDKVWNGYFSLMESATESGQFYATIMVEEAGE